MHASTHKAMGNAKKVKEGEREREKKENCRHAYWLQQGQYKFNWPNYTQKVNTKVSGPPLLNPARFCCGTGNNLQVMTWLVQLFVASPYGLSCYDHVMTISLVNCVPCCDICMVRVLEWIAKWGWMKWKIANITKCRSSKSRRRRMTLSRRNLFPNEFAC